MGMSRSGSLITSHDRHGHGGVGRRGSCLVTERYLSFFTHGRPWIRAGGRWHAVQNYEPGKVSLLEFLAMRRKLQVTVKQKSLCRLSLRFKLVLHIQFLYGAQWPRPNSGSQSGFTSNKFTVILVLKVDRFKGITVLTLTKFFCHGGPSLSGTLPHRRWHLFVAVVLLLLLCLTQHSQTDLRTLLWHTGGRANVNSFKPNKLFSSGGVFFGVADA